MINYNSFANEFIKIATSKWREMLRMGQIGSDDVARLRKSKLLRYGKETAGLERGNKNLMKRMGIKEVADPGGMPRYDPGKKTYFHSPEGMREHLSDAYDRKLLSNLSKKDDAAAQALVRRHEIDEARIANRRMKTHGMESWPSQEQLVQITADALEGERGFGKDLMSGSTMSHLSPEVVAREHRNLAFMPKSVQKGMQGARRKTGVPEYDMARVLGGRGGFGQGDTGALSRAQLKKVDKRWKGMSLEDKMEFANDQTAKSVEDIMANTPEGF